MAIVKGPALSINASGNVGSICFAKWRGFQIARAAWSGDPTPTGLQTAQKNRAVTAAQYWGEVLTDAERASWRAAAFDKPRLSRLGTMYTPSGYHYFLGLSIQLLRQGFEIIPFPPIAKEPFMHMSVLASMVVGYNDKLRTYFVDRTPEYPDDIRGEDWMAGPFTSGGYHPQKYDYRFANFRTITGGKLYSGLSLNSYYWFKMRWIDASGRVGNWFETSIFIPPVE